MFNHSTVGTHWKFCKYVGLSFPSRFPMTRAWSGWSRLFPESRGGRAALSFSQLALATGTMWASVWAVASFSFCSEPLLLFLEWFEPHGFSMASNGSSTRPAFISRCSVIAGALWRVCFVTKDAGEGDGATCLCAFLPKMSSV